MSAAQLVQAVITMTEGEKLSVTCMFNPKEYTVAKTNSWPKDQKALTTVKNYINSVIDTLQKAGDKNVHFLEFTPQDGNADGLGSDWHPSVKTHQKMGEKLAAALKKELGW